MRSPSYLFTDNVLRKKKRDWNFRDLNASKPHQFGAPSVTSLTFLNERTHSKSKARFKRRTTSVPN